MSKAQSAQSRAKKIKLLLFDVDGVLTDGKIFVFPAPLGTTQASEERASKREDQGGFGLISQTMIEAKGFHAHDGAAISLARLAGIKTGLITRRISETVALRARDLRLEHVHQGIQDKLTCFEQILKQAIPRIRAVVDATDHALGQNPFYTADKGGESPFHQPAKA